eukprot:COSAG02_NODE_23109_length_730_cov_0.835182_1_plen_93_part_10
MTPQPEELEGAGEMEPAQDGVLPPLDMAGIDKPVIPQSPQVREQEADRDRDGARHLCTAAGRGHCYLRFLSSPRKRCRFCFFVCSLTLIVGPD